MPLIIIVKISVEINIWCSSTSLILGKRGIVSLIYAIDYNFYFTFSHILWQNMIFWFFFLIQRSSFVQLQPSCSAVSSFFLLTVSSMVVLYLANFKIYMYYQKLDHGFLLMSAILFNIFVHVYFIFYSIYQNKNINLKKGAQLRVSCSRDRQMYNNKKLS